MKNLMIYTNPNRRFDEETAKLRLLSIWILTSLGWKKEDIILVTNFKYQYNGVRALAIGDVYYLPDPTSNKVPVIVHLFDELEDDLYWYHDTDAYQNAVITENELELSGFDMGLTTYGYKVHWNCGSFFFKKSARDIFELWHEKILFRGPRGRADEKALKRLTDWGTIGRERYKIMDITYNFQYLYLPGKLYYYNKAIRPLRVLHFHPYWTKKEDYRLSGDNMMDVFMHGRGAIKFPLMSEGLIKVFNKHGIK